MKSSRITSAPAHSRGGIREKRIKKEIEGNQSAVAPFIEEEKKSTWVGRKKEVSRAKVVIVKGGTGGRKSPSADDERAFHARGQQKGDVGSR